MNKQSYSQNIYRVKQLLNYAIVGILVTVIISLLQNRYQLSEIKDIRLLLFFGLLFGTLLGILDDAFIYTSLSKWKYKYRTLFKILIIPVIVVIIILFYELFFNAEIFSKREYGEGKIYRTFYYLFQNPLLISAFLAAFIITIFNELRLVLGPNFLGNYIIGNFRGPTKEDRIFMFLDLKDSTSIAENIGDIKFYELLNDCYSMLGTVSIHRKAEILKYVGDEAILTWSYGSKKNSRNCIELFFDFKNLLENNKKYFLEKYNLHPKFTAGAHHGSVISAYLGSVKRQKDYSGDVMNTTARIGSMTTQYNAEFLISEDLFDKLQMEEHEGEKIESITLKGKAKPINIYKIS